MTVNVNARPNSVHLHGDTTFGHHFGGIYSVTPICLPGVGHVPHVDVRFLFGLLLQLSPGTAMDLARELERAVAKLPVVPDVHDAIGGGE